MLNFDFTKQYGHLVNHKSAYFVSEKERLDLVAGLVNKDMSHREISEAIGISRKSVQVCIKRLKRIQYDTNRLHELDTFGNRSKLLYNRITDLLDKGNNNYQVSKILSISPSTVLRVLQRFNDDRGSMLKHLQGDS